MILARTLLAAYEDGARICYLEVRRSNQAAIQLYEQFGFVLTSIRPRYYRDNNEDALLMTLDPIEPKKIRPFLDRPVEGKNPSEMIKDSPA